jgi:hypothetical protein
LAASLRLFSSARAFFDFGDPGAFYLRIGYLTDPAGLLTDSPAILSTSCG